MKRIDQMKLLEAMVDKEALRRLASEHQRKGAPKPLGTRKLKLKLGLTK